MTMEYRFANAFETVVVAIGDDGERLIPVEPNNPEYADLIASGVEIGPFVQKPSEAPSVASIAAMAELSINGDEISGVETAAGIGGAMAIDAGVYWIFFPEPLPDASYLPFVQAPGFYVDWTDRQPEYFEIAVSDRDTRQAATPAKLLISVQRIK